MLLFWLAFVCYGNKGNYYSTWTADLQECFEICSWKQDRHSKDHGTSAIDSGEIEHICCDQDCTGIEHERKNNYCEAEAPGQVPKML